MTSDSPEVNPTLASTDQADEAGDESEETASSASSAGAGGSGRGAAEQSYIVGVGASAGGLEAIKAFFDNVPSSCPHSFVIIQHLSPDHKSLMGDLLKRNTQLPIHEAKDAMLVEPGSIYLIPPRSNLELRDRRLYLSDKSVTGGLNLPIDIFLTSLAMAEGDRAIGIILTGTGSDGTRGVRAIKETGGMVMVQDPVEAPFDGMPLSAINTGLVDYVLPVDELPAELQSFIDHPTTNGLIHSSVESETELISLIIGRVKAITDLDFTHYKRPTLARRIERRMSIKKCGTLEDYLSVLHAEPKEAEILSRECLIGVTRFFRDAEVWDALAREVLPGLIRERYEQRKPIRVWSVGCSTGEEVYSMAILLEEVMARLDKHCDVKIFATDISEQHLSIASKGQYSESIIADVRPDRLSRHFVKVGDDYQTTESLRSKAIFSPHNVLRDPPFKDIDLVICRNMLIYLQPIAQQKALASLHYSLRLNGTLMLGPSENIGDFKVALKEINAKAKLYRNDSPSRGFGLDIIRYPDLRERAGTPRKPRVSPVEARAAEVLSETLTTEMELAAVFIDDAFDIIHAVGEIRSFAELPPEGFSSNLLKLLDNNLSASVSTAVRKAKLQNTEVHYRGVIMNRGGAWTKLNVVVRPFTFDNPDWRQCYAVILIPQGPEDGDDVSRNTVLANVADTDRVTEVEQELKDTRESLQAAIEELETTNEELQATNEELMAANEELQSTNEELQSMNEELHTVNSEHQQKISELADVNADMDNLLQSTDIGTIFLDGEMRIRKFTPLIQEAFNLRSVDVGRPLAHFTNEFHSSDSARLLALAGSVLETGDPVDVEISTPSERTELVKLAPFRSRTGQIDGVVMSFVDITELKQVQADYARQNATFEQVLEGAMAGHWEHRPGSTTMHLSPSFKAMLGYEPDQMDDTIEAFLRSFHPDEVDQARRFIEELNSIAVGEAVESEFRFTHKNGSTVWAWTRGKVAADETEAGDSKIVIGCFVDISPIKQVQAELERTNDELGQFAYLTSHDLQEPLRTVSNFVQVLERRYRDRLDDDGVKYLEIVAQATARMQDLIRGILQYSTIGRDGVREVIDLESVVFNVVNDLDIAISESGATIEIGDLPKVVGFEPELRTLFANLISNAIKFRREDTAPVVRITAERANGDKPWRFSVSDNGIGIDETDRERVFEIFNRLHSKGQYEGAGIGLAHARKIVELHDGRLWVESEPDEGSTFRFTLGLK